MMQNENAYITNLVRCAHNGNDGMDDIAWMHGGMDAWMYVDHAIMHPCSHAIMQSCTPPPIFFVLLKNEGL